MHILAFLQNINWWEAVIVLGIALLLFGKRLPEVGRSLGKGIIEFKRGLKGIEDQIEDESSRPAKPAPRSVSEAEQPPKFASPATPTGPDVRVSRADPMD